MAQEDALLDVALRVCRSRVPPVQPPRKHLLPHRFEGWGKIHKVRRAKRAELDPEPLCKQIHMRSRLRVGRQCCDPPPHGPGQGLMGDTLSPGGVGHGLLLLVYTLPPICQNIDWVWR